MSTWVIDSSHSSVNFSVRHLVIAKVHGSFNKFEGQVESAGEGPDGGKVTATIDVSSIATRDEKRDGHLLSADFLDAATFPTIVFASSKIDAVKGEHFNLVGSLTIHGVTKDITLAVESLGRAKDPWGNERAAFTAHTHLDRKDFGLTWNQALETGGVLVGEKVEITIEVELIRKAG